MYKLVKYGGPGGVRLTGKSKIRFADVTPKAFRLFGARGGDGRHAIPFESLLAPYKKP